MEHDLLDEIFALVDAPGGGGDAAAAATAQPSASLDLDLEGLLSGPASLASPVAAAPSAEAAAAPTFVVTAAAAAAAAAPPPPPPPPATTAQPLATLERAQPDDDDNATDDEPPAVPGAAAHHVFHRPWSRAAEAQLQRALGTLQEAPRGAEGVDDVEAQAEVVRLCLEHGCAPPALRSQAWAAALGVSLRDAAFPPAAAAAAGAAEGAPPPAEQLRREAAAAYKAAVEGAGAGNVALSLEETARVLGWAAARAVAAGPARAPLRLLATCARMLVPLLAAQPALPVGTLARCFGALLQRVAPSSHDVDDVDGASASAGGGRRLRMLCGHLRLLLAYHDPALVSALDGAAGPGWCQPRAPAGSPAERGGSGGGCLPAGWLTSWFAGPSSAAPCSAQLLLWDRLLLAACGGGSGGGGGGGADTGGGGPLWDLHAVGPTSAASTSALLLAGHLLVSESASLALIARNDPASAAYLVHLTLEGATKRVLQRLAPPAAAEAAADAYHDSQQQQAAAVGVWMQAAHELARATPPSFLAFCQAPVAAEQQPQPPLSPACGDVIRVPPRAVAAQLVYGYAAVADAAREATRAADAVSLPHPRSHALLLPAAGLHAAGAAAAGSCGPGAASGSSGGDAAARQLRQMLLQLHGRGRYLVVDVRPIAHRAACGRVAKAIHIDPRSLGLPPSLDAESAVDADAATAGLLAALPPAESLPSAASLVGLPLADAVREIGALVAAQEAAQAAALSRGDDDAEDAAAALAGGGSNRPARGGRLSLACAPLHIAVLGIGARHQSVWRGGSAQPSAAQLQPAAATAAAEGPASATQDAEAPAGAHVIDDASSSPEGGETGGGSEGAAVLPAEGSSAAHPGGAPGDAPEPHSTHDDAPARADGSEAGGAGSAPDASAALAAAVCASDDARVQAVVAALLHARAPDRPIPYVVVVDGGYVGLHHTLVKPCLGLARPLAPPRAAVTALVASLGAHVPSTAAAASSSSSSGVGDGDLTLEDALTLHAAVLLGEHELQPHHQQPHRHIGGCLCCESLVRDAAEAAPAASMTSFLAASPLAAADGSGGGVEGGFYRWARSRGSGGGDAAGTDGSSGGGLTPLSAAATLELLRERVSQSLAPAAAVAADRARVAAAGAADAASQAVGALRGFVSRAVAAGAEAAAAQAPDGSGGALNERAAAAAAALGARAGQLVSAASRSLQQARSAHAAAAPPAPDAAAAGVEPAAAVAATGSGSGDAAALPSDTAGGLQAGHTGESPAVSGDGGGGAIAAAPATQPLPSAAPAPTAASSSSAPGAASLTSSARYEGRRLAAKLLQVGKAALAPPPASTSASSSAAPPAAPTSAATLPPAASAALAHAQVAAASARDRAGAAVMGFAARAREKMAALQAQAEAARAAAQPHPSAGGFTVGAALRGASAAPAKPAGGAAAAAAAAAVPPREDGLTAHRLSGLRPGDVLQRAQLPPDASFSPAMKEKLDAETGDESLVPRYIVLTDQRVMVLARVEGEHASVGPADRAYTIKSNHHISELAKLGYSKKQPSRVSLYYRRSGPAAAAATEAAAAAAPAAAAADESGPSPAPPAGGPPTAPAAVGDGFVVTLVQRVYHLESQPAADELKSRLQAAIARLMAV